MPTLRAGAVSMTDPDTPVADRAEPGPAFARRAFVTFFLILAAHSLPETARDALFLSRLPVSQLPWMYLLVAVVSILVARLTTLTAAHLRHSLLPSMLLVSAVIS